MIVLHFLTLPTMTLLISRQCTAKTRQDKPFLTFPTTILFPLLTLLISRQFTAPSLTRY